MSINQKLQEAIGSHSMFHIFGIPITDTVLVMWIIMAVLIIAALILTRKMVTVPKGKQNVVEIIVEFINNFTKDIIGHHWKHFAPYIGTILMFLVLSNIISIFNVFGIFHVHMRPPTKSVFVTVPMALMTIMLVLGSSIRFKKVSGWLKSFIEPMPIAIFTKVLDYFTRPLSLSLRLFGNIIGAFIVMELIYSVVPLFVPAALSIYFDLFDGILQAYVFVFLTTLYVAEAIE
jgi:F-type H+-transporting ATPase subunit a